MKAKEVRVGNKERYEEKTENDKFKELIELIFIVSAVTILILRGYQWFKKADEEARIYRERKEYTQQLLKEINQNCNFSVLEKSKGFVPLDRICKNLPEIVSLFSFARIYLK